jgi:hypothetical protein
MKKAEKERHTKILKNISARTTEIYQDINVSKPTIWLNNVEWFSSYITENTLRIHYKGQLFDATEEKSNWPCESYESHKFIVGKLQVVWIHKDCPLKG